MSGYDYGNARLRAMKSRLLSRSEIESLAQTGSITFLINALAKTPYCRAIEAALVRTTDIDCISEALSRDLVDTLGKAHQFFNGREGQLIAIALRSYDVNNLKTILRGLRKQVMPDDITANLLPVGDLSPALLSALASASEPRVVIDMLVSMRLPVAQPLIELRAKRPGAGISEMELALDRWHYEQAFSHFEGSPRSTSVISSALALEADLTNLLTALRFVHSPAERRVLYERFGTDDLGQLFVGPGRLSFRLLAQVGAQNTLEDAVELLVGTPYESSLKAGLGGYLHSERLSDFEKQLRCFRLNWMARLIVKDPLGIGVPLGYFALKTNEVANIRWVAQGIGLGLEPDAITADLEFAA
jgi:V/A-type H+-transporting ATPase subunit C